MKKKINNNKSFGILFSIVFLIVAFWPILNDNQIRVWSLIVSSIFLLLGITRSRFLTPLNLGWIKFGEILGVIISPIVMGAVYFFVVLPIGIFMKILGKDFLRLKRDKESTYWINRDFKTNFKKQF